MPHTRQMVAQARYAFRRCTGVVVAAVMRLLLPFRVVLFVSPRPFSLAASFFSSALSSTPATGSGSLGVSFNVLSTMVVRVCVTEGMTFICRRSCPTCWASRPRSLTR